MLLPDVVKVPVGTVAKTHGIKGELNVTLLADAGLEAGDAVILEVDGLDVPFFIASVRPKGEDAVLLMLDDVSSDTDAQQFVGSTLYVYSDPDEQAEDDGMAASGFIGFTLWDGPVQVGTVDDVVELTPGCWYFRLRESDRLIPIADELIVDYDASAAKLVMNLPEGLLDL